MLVLWLMVAVSSQEILYNSMDTDLSLTYSISTDFTQLTILFSQPLALNSIDFQSTLTINIIGLQQEQYNWTVMSPPTLNNSTLTYQGIYDTYVVEFNYLENFYFKDLVLRFVAPYSILSYNGSSSLGIQYQILAMNIGPYGSLTQLGAFLIDFTVYLTIGLLGLAFLLYCVFKINSFKSEQVQPGLGRTLNLFWGIVDITQLLNIVLFLKCELTVQVRRELQIFNWVNFNYHIDIVTDIFFQQNDQSQNIFDLLYQEGKNTSMVYNTFIQWILLILCILVTVISVVGLKGHQKIKDTIQYGLLLRASSITLCSLSFASCIEIQRVLLGSLQNKIDVTVLCLSLLWILGYFLLAFIFLNQNQLEPIFKMNFENYSPLIDGLHTKAIFKRSMYLVQDFRRVIFAVMVAFLYDWSNTCISLILLVQILYVMILATKYPWRVGVVNFGITLSEFLFTATLMLIALTMYLDFVSPGYFNIQSRTIVGWINTSFILLICLIRFICMIFEFNILKLLISNDSQQVQKTITELQEQDEDNEEIEMVSHNEYK